jgi:hypothetical protein
MEKNKIYVFSLKKRKNKIKGSLLFRSDKVTSIFNLPVDFLIDGVTFINNEKIHEALPFNDQLFESVINNKLTSIKALYNKFTKGTEFNDYKALFQYLKKNNTFCELSLSKEDVIYIGEIINVHENSVDIDFYSTKFELQDNAYVEFDDIFSVTILSDYVKTIQSEIKK